MSSYTQMKSLMEREKFREDDLNTFTPGKGRDDATKDRASCRPRQTSKNAYY